MRRGGEVLTGAKSLREQARLRSADADVATHCSPGGRLHGPDRALGRPSLSNAKRDGGGHAQQRSDEHRGDRQRSTNRRHCRAHDPAARIWPDPDADRERADHGTRK
jgi:hypothetical protein